MEQRQYKNSGVVIAKKFIIFEIVIAPSSGARRACCRTKRTWARSGRP
ncbi:hypothetical protein [Candidatus Methanomethylophilus sp. 1R26]|nr:hypothetical protein [Candidatus Methanomethylophilus sp. 1R26]